MSFLKGLQEPYFLGFCILPNVLTLSLNDKCRIHGSCLLSFWDLTGITTTAPTSQPPRFLVLSLAEEKPEANLLFFSLGTGIPVPLGEVWFTQVLLLSVPFHSLNFPGLGNKLHGQTQDDLIWFCLDAQGFLLCHRSPATFLTMQHLSHLLSTLFYPLGPRRLTCVGYSNVTLISWVPAGLGQGEYWQETRGSGRARAGSLFPTGVLQTGCPLQPSDPPPLLWPLPPL